MNIRKELFKKRLLDNVFTIFSNVSYPLIYGRSDNLASAQVVYNDMTDIVDNIIMTPGQYMRIENCVNKSKFLTGIRCDWMDLKRNDYSLIKSREFQHEVLFETEYLNFLGAEFAYTSFLVGGEEYTEIKELKLLSSLIHHQMGNAIPVIAEIVPVGEKINDNNISGAVKLAISIIQELGVDAISIPYVNFESVKEIKTFAKRPILLKINSNNKSEIIENINQAKKYIDGVVLGENFFSLHDYRDTIKMLKNI